MEDEIIIIKDQKPPASALTAMTEVQEKSSCVKRRSIDSSIDMVIKKNKFCATLEGSNIFLEGRGTDEHNRKRDKAQSLGEEVRKRREQGYTFAQIAMELRLPLSTCYFAMRKLKLSKAYSESLKDAVKRRKNLGFVPLPLKVARMSDMLSQSGTTLNKSVSQKRASPGTSKGAVSFNNRLIRSARRSHRIKGRKSASQRCSEREVSSSRENFVEVVSGSPSASGESNSEFSSPTVQLLQMVSSSLANNGRGSDKARNAEGVEETESDLPESDGLLDVVDYSAVTGNMSSIGQKASEPLRSETLRDIILRNMHAFLTTEKTVRGTQFCCKLCSKIFPSMDSKNVSRHVRLHHPSSFIAGFPLDLDYNPSRFSGADMKEQDSCSYRAGEVRLSDVVSVNERDRLFNVNDRAVERFSPAWKLVMPGSAADIHRCVFCGTEIKSAGVSDIIQHMRHYHMNLLQDSNLFVGSGSKRSNPDRSFNVTLMSGVRDNEEGPSEANSHDPAECASNSAITKAPRTENSTITTTDVALVSGADSPTSSPANGASISFAAPPMEDNSGPLVGTSVEGRDSQDVIEGIKKKLSWTNEKLAAATDPQQIIALMNVISSGLSILDKFGYI